MTKAAVHFIHIVTDDLEGKLKHSQMEQKKETEKVPPIYEEVQQSPSKMCNLLTGHVVILVGKVWRSRSDRWTLLWECWKQHIDVYSRRLSSPLTSLSAPVSLQGESALEGFSSGIRTKSMRELRDALGESK